MIYCKRCLYPANHPYGMVFDEFGICMGCRVHEEKDTIDWDNRLILLKQLVNLNKKNVSGNNFDCIVPVTGGGDSFFTVHVVKNILGMNPLLVNYNSHFNTRVGIRNLAKLTTVFDCDIVTSTLSPDLLKRITKHTLTSFGSMYWQALAGYLTFPVQSAVKFKIPLIIWGLQPWSEQTGMFSHLDQSEMTERCRKEHGLMGIGAEDLIDAESGISRSDVQPFVYPYDNEIEAVGVRGIYLSNFLRWDSKKQHELMIETYGYESAQQRRTFNTYEDVHCFHSAGVHDYIKYLKYGFSKVSDHATREIRLKRMTREQGIAEVMKFSEREPVDLDMFLNWVGMSKDQFYSSVWNRRDPNIWEKDSKGNWLLLDNVENHMQDFGVDEARLEITGDSNFIITPSSEPEEPDKEYLLMGRGYLDKYNFGALDDQPTGGLTTGSWQQKNLN